MPQMSPMNWLLLNIYFMLAYFLLLMMIYFMIKNLNFNNVKLFNKKLNYMIKWY